MIRKFENQRKMMSFFAHKFCKLRTAYLVTSSIYALVTAMIIFLSGFMVKNQISANDTQRIYMVFYFLMTLKEFIHLKGYWKSPLPYKLKEKNKNILIIIWLNE